MSFIRTTTALLIASAALPLTGCPSVPSYPMPYLEPAIKPIVRDSVATFTGPTLADAYHAADQWMDRYYPPAELLSAEGLQIDRAGRSGRTGWVFRFRVPGSQIAPFPMPAKPATKSAKPRYVLMPGEEGSMPGAPATGTVTILPIDMPIDPWPEPSTDSLPVPEPIIDPMPIVSNDRFVSLAVDGRGRVLAPEEARDDFKAGVVSFGRTVALQRLLDEIPDLGAQIGDAGAKVSLYARDGRTVFEIDPQVATRTEPQPEPYYDSDPAPIEPAYGPEPYPYGEDAIATSGGHSRPQVRNQTGGLVDSRSNQPAGRGVMCVAPPSRPVPYDSGQPGVLYRGTYLFDAYTAELLGRPQRL